MAQLLDSRTVRALRPPKRGAPDPFAPPDVIVETERSTEGGAVRAATIFLTGAECPFSCVFCDLWRHTLDGSTPAGAIPAQIRSALEGVHGGPPANIGREISGGGRPGSSRIEALKLYNASNFFDGRAVPVEDDAAILELLSPFGRVTVECHPRLVGERCLAFGQRLAGRLEVAMGLETVHPLAFPLLNKGMQLDDFSEASTVLRQAGHAVRAFVLVGCPYIAPADSVEWAVRSAEWAVQRGAGRVSLIPVRGGAGALDRLAGEGDFVEPELAGLEEALDRCLKLDALVTADTWDADRFADCPDCATVRIRRLEQIGLTGRLEPRVSCAVCGAGSLTADR